MFSIGSLHLVVEGSDTRKEMISNFINLKFVSISIWRKKKMQKQ